MKTYFISDTHFNHTNVIKYCNRPFETAEEMNNEIIKRWNSVVKKDDIVWFLGDWGMGGRNQIKSCIEKLNGKIRMIYGNHDNLPLSFYQGCKNIEYVSKYPVVIKGMFILSHAPMENLEGTGFFNIFGHIHTNEEYKTKTINSQCVCVERQNYFPIRIEEFDNKN